jgi:hypothetical protein
MWDIRALERTLHVNVATVAFPFGSKVHTPVPM